MLIAPGGHYHAFGFGDADGDGEVDHGIMWDCTEAWPFTEGQIKLVTLTAEVEFPDPEPPAIPATVETPQ